MNGVLSILLEASLRISLLAVVAAVALRACRARAGAARHTVWTVIAAGMLAMPLLQLWMPRVPVPIGPPATASIDHLAQQEPQLWIPQAEPSAVSKPTTKPERPAIIAAPAQQVRSAGQPTRFWPSAAVAVYVTGIFFSLAWVALGMRLARRMVKTGLAVPDLRTAAPVYESPVLATPVAIGILQPRIFLPAGWNQWPAAKLRAVLAHESAHVRRRDSLVNLLAQANRCVFWFHPLAWWLQKELANTAEQACDDESVRALGTPRQYAEILLEMAETVRRTGGRYSWQAIGMDGDGRLERRIDRILQESEVRKVSKQRKAAIAVVCAASIFLAAACQRQTAVAPLQDDPDAAAKKAQSQARNEAYAERIVAAKALTAPQVAVLEAALAKNPEDMQSREQLLMFYTFSGGKVIGEKSTAAGRRKQILGLIEHHPESELVASFYFQNAPSVWFGDPDDFSEARRLWQHAINRPGAVPAIFAHAALFFQTTDLPFAEKLAARAHAMDPVHYNPLPSIYFAALVGDRVQPATGAASSVPTATHSSYRDTVQRTLAESNDVELLARMSYDLAIRGYSLYIQHQLDFDPMPLARTYAERALQLDPNSIAAHEAMVRCKAIAIADEPPNFWKLEPPEQYAIASKLPVAERISKLAAIAQRVYGKGKSADYYQHDAVKAKADWEQARQYATEALQLQASNGGPAQDGTAYYRANMTLGMVAMRDGDRPAAVKRMFAAAQAPRTEELAYTYQSFTLDLPRWLLKDGERQSVIQFLERFAQTSVIQKQYYLDAAALIRQGKKPIFYTY